MEYIEFLPNEQEQFITSCKKNSNLNWPELASSISKSRSLMFAYKSESCKIPYNTFKKLSQLYSVYPSRYKIISLKNTKVTISIPPLSPKLSEIFGILAGDGHISKSEVCIISHKVLDMKHILHCKKLFQELFSIEGQFCYQNKTVKLRFYSQELVEFLHKLYNLPLGKKKGKLEIPKQLNTIPLLNSYIRGLFDTDGSIYNHHKKNSATIEISSRDKEFLDSIYQTLAFLGYTPSKSEKSVKIYRQSQIQKFFKTIKPSNSKHVIKWQLFQILRVVPKNKDMLHIMRE